MAISRVKLSNIIFLLVVLAFLVFLFWPTRSAPKPRRADREAQTAQQAVVTPDVPPLLAQRYKSIADSIDEARVKADIINLSSYPSRLAGYPGSAQAASYVEEQFRKIGLDDVKSESFRVTVPVDEGSKIVVGGQELEIHALWPNLVRTSHLPPEGLQVNVIDAGGGKLPDFDGKLVKGSAALVDFNSGTEWLNAPRLGASVLLFVEPDSTMRGEGESKFSAIPVSMPRFWISKANAAKLRELIKQGKAEDARVFCSMPWEKVTSRNIIGVIRGSDKTLRDQWIVLHSFYDGTSVVPSLTPGAESTCGMAGLLELARLYKDPRFAPKRSIMFIAAGAHFQGLAGMRAHIEKHIDSYTLPGTMDNIHAKMNSLWPAGETTKGVSPLIPVFVVLVVMLLVVWGIWARLRPIQSKRGWVALIPVLLAVLSVYYAVSLYGSFAKGFDYEVPNPQQFYVWCGLDLSSQTEGVGVFFKGYFYDYREDLQSKFSDLASRARENSERVAHTLGFLDKKDARFADGVNPVSGKNWRNFVPGKIALDSEVVTLAGGQGVSFVSIDDGRPLVDTPFDTNEKLNFSNLKKQLVMIGCLADHWFRDTISTMEDEIVQAKVVDGRTVVVDDPLAIGFVQGVYMDKFARGRNYYKPKADRDMPESLVNGRLLLSSDLPKDAKAAYVQHKPITRLGVSDRCKFTRMGLQGGFARLSGHVVQYDPRRSFVPNLKVGDCLAVVRSAHKSFMGVRANIIDKTTAREGYFEIPGVAPQTAYGFGRPTSIGAYKLDQIAGDIICAPDQGSYGQVYPTTFPVTTGVKDMPIIVFDCKATSIYDLVDPQSLSALPGLAVYDGDTNGAPRQFGAAVAVPEPQNPHVEDMAVIFTEDTKKSKSLAIGASSELRRVRLKLVMASGPASNRLLLLNSSLDTDVIPAKLVSVDGKIMTHKAAPAQALWQPSVQGAYLVKGNLEEAKNYYRVDPGEVDYSITSGIVDLDPAILDVITPDRGQVHVTLSDGETCEADLIKTISLEKPWYKTVLGVFVNEDLSGKDYLQKPSNEGIAKSLRSSDVLVGMDLPNASHVYIKARDKFTGKIDTMRVAIDNVIVKGLIVGDNPLQVKALGVYDNESCTGTNYYEPESEAESISALALGGPKLTYAQAGAMASKTVWIKTNGPKPIKATVNRSIQVDRPIGVFVDGVYNNRELKGTNYCKSPFGPYNNATLLNGEIQLTSYLPEGTKEVFIKPMPKSEGIGYDVTDGGTLDETAYKVGNDMWRLDEDRLLKLESKGVVNEGLRRLHNEARRLLDLADTARDSLSYSVFDSYCRAAWGYEARAYPSVTASSQDVVNGVIFYLFLMLPFAFFAERLFFAFPSLTKQIIAIVLIFAALFFIFYLVHPAFQIVGNASLVVMIAFVMLALSLMVISIITGKFEEQLKQFNRSVSGIHKADIGRMSVAAAAFSLGISNMRRRKARTVLTCVTLVLLTFIVLSFTSIVSELRFNKVPAKRDTDTKVYDGIMLRTAMWDALQEIAYRHLNDEFGNAGRGGKVYPVAPRAWFYGTQMGEQSFLTLRKGANSYDTRAAAGMVPDEALIMDLNTTNRRAFVAGDWFGYKDGKRVSTPVDRYSMIIPDAAAEKLGIAPEDVGKAQVEFGGAKYTVIAIIKNDFFKKIKDLDNEPLTPVDFILMSKQSAQQQQGGEAGFREYTHHEPANVFIVPYDTLMSLGGSLRSIAIKFATVEQVRDQLDALMPRLGLNLYAGVGGSIYRYSSIAASSSKGFSNVFVPVLIASLIVLNTMLGSVYERVREIGIFSSIGLAPNHIAILFIAESMVYANLGAVAGYVLGQAASKLLMVTNILPGLYLNFSSMSAVTSTIVVVAVVLLSTLYPARKASEVATPSVDRSWKVPEPVGDNWDIVLPFAVTGEQAAGVNKFLKEWFLAYEEYSIGDFVTQDVASLEEESEFGTAHVITCKTWLAPFDLGVSQLVKLQTVPTNMEDVYEVLLRITRESGDISNWKRVNRRFLNTLRKQFLIWRTLKAQDRDKYLLAGGQSADPEASPA